MQDKILPVDYYYQIDNTSGDGYRECCATANAMMLNYVLNGYLKTEALKRKITQPESIYLDALDGDTTDHGANTRTLQTFGVKSHWSTRLSMNDYTLSIAHNIPMVLGFAYKGHGHITCGIGHQDNLSKIIVHDPYGSRNGDSDNWLSNSETAGKFDVYALQTFKNLWFPAGSLGWGRIVTHILGKPTIFA